MADAMRKQVLAEFTSSRTLIGGLHLSFPGIGRVHEQGEGCVLLPLPYNSHPDSAK